MIIIITLAILIVIFFIINKKEPINSLIGTGAIISPTGNVIDWEKSSILGVQFDDQNLLVQDTVSSKTLVDLMAEEKPIKILIVPGHDEKSGGSEFSGIAERKLNVQLAYYLIDLLKEENNITADVVKNKDGTYADWFNQYLEENKLEIILFKENSRKIMEKTFKDISPSLNSFIFNNAPEETSLNLYAINKYIDDHQIDIVLHIHFNDHPRKNYNSKGKYSGFSIFVPDSQFLNGEESKNFALAIKNHLETIIPKSTHPLESRVIIEDQKLIAIGANVSRQNVSALIEYGYIYESQILSKNIRDVFLKELAFQTYLGIREYLRKENNQDTTLLPHTWDKNMKKGKGSSEDVLSLQMALKQESLFPPNNKSLQECALDGIFGNCTNQAVIDFQEKYKDETLEPLGYKKGTGFVDSLTISKLNELYSQ